MTVLWVARKEKQHETQTRTQVSQRTTTTTNGQSPGSPPNKPAERGRQGATVPNDHDAAHRHVWPARKGAGGLTPGRAEQRLAGKQPLPPALPVPGLAAGRGASVPGQKAAADMKTRQHQSNDKTREGRRS